jgi:hypothetical protein
MSGKPKQGAASVPVIKRKEKQEELPRVYEMVGNKGGVLFKVRTANLNVYDKESGKMRQLRYCAGENSPWLDEQSPNSVREHIVFRDKILVVPPDKPNLIRHLDLHPDNAANGGGAFRLVEKSKQKEVEVANEFLINDAIYMIKNRDINELLPVAMALHINVDQTNLEIKREMILYAKRKPKEFMEMFDNPAVNVRSIVKQAIDFNIIKENNGVISWFDTRKTIVTSPSGISAEDTMTRYCMTDAGAATYEELQKQLEAIA